MQNKMRKRLLTIMLALSLIMSAGMYAQVRAEEEVLPETNFIDIDPSKFDPSLTADIPFGIDCGTESDQRVYVTLLRQGLLAEIDKLSRNVTNIYNDPDHAFVQREGPQDFYSITRDPDTGNLFVNELSNAKLWRFNPITQEWTRIPLIERIPDPDNPNVPHPYVEYPDAPRGVGHDGISGYDVDPTFVLLHTSSGFNILADLTVGTHGDGTVVFAGGFVWVGLSISIDWRNFPVPPEDGLQNLDFQGLVKVDPITAQVVERIPIPGAVTVTGIAVDSDDPNIFWITDIEGHQVFKFDIVNKTVVAPTPVSLASQSNPRGIDTDSSFVFVALNEDGGEGKNTTIARIDKQTLQVDLLDMGALNSISGAFTVLVENGLLVVTDESRHIIFQNLINGTLFPPVSTKLGSVGNHFACFVTGELEDELWFAGQGSAKVGIAPTSKYIGGRPVRTSLGGGGGGTGGSGGSQYRGRDFAFGDLSDPNYDGNAPAIEEVLIQEGSIKILAKITDTVGVKDAQVIIGKKAFPMSHHAGSQSWWYRAFTADDLQGTADTLSGKIVARDFNDNKAEHSFTLEVPFGALSAATQGSSFVIAPLLGVGEQTEQRYSIIAGGVGHDSQNINPWITIKNTSTEPLQNIRLVLSPELRGKFLLSDYAIKNVAPQSEYTVSLKLNGKPNVDAMNNPIPYRGNVIISVDNRSPYILHLSGEIPNESASLQSLFMKMISNKGEQRYKTFEKPDQRISQDADYKITLGSGENTIKGADELIITNTGDKPLKNLRILTSSISDHIIPEQKNIDLLPAGSFIKVKLVSKMNDAGSSRDLLGEVIVAPENGTPVSVPINIGKQLLKDKNKMYEVTITSGSNSVTHTSDSIVIRNNSEESVDNVRVILPQQLARVFSLSKDSFKTIEPNTEETIYLQQRGTMNSNAKQILNDYTGDIIIVSSDGMKKVIPVNIVWKGISSEHFVVNARDNTEELAKATQVINFLERSYGGTAALLGETNTRTVIYMTSSLDEVSRLSDALAPSTYVYDEDVAFVWSNSEDVNMLALKEFAYRAILQNYGTYWAKQKITLDKGNWMVDGISNYVTSSIVGERGLIKEQLEAFAGEPTSFEWYGVSTPSQHGASYTLFKFLAEKYGDTIIDKILNNLGSTMVSNNRCETMEQCALLKAVYDANGIDINDKRHDLSFDTIAKGWDEYIEKEHTIKAQP